MTLHYTQGNLLEARVDALVNTVNTEGVMGKGIALQFKEAFPANFDAYQRACKDGLVQVGHMFVTRNEELVGPTWIINFPTKGPWRQPSKLEYIKSGLVDLVCVLREKGIHSVALPPLGCGHGGLSWSDVKREIEIATSNLSDIEIVIFEPTLTYHGQAKRKGVEQLTPPRALLVEAIRRYGMLGFDCTNLEVQKLAYFLQRVLTGMGLPNVLRLDFKAHKYGPYADNLRHLLDDLDGSYLHAKKRLADAGPLDPIVIDLGRLNRIRAFWHENDGKLYSNAMDKTAEIWDGFQSPYQMELLATVDWLQHNAEKLLATEELLKGIESWPGGEASAKRKRNLFKQREVEIARSHLSSYESLLYPSSDLVSNVI